MLRASRLGTDNARIKPDEDECVPQQLSPISSEHRWGLEPGKHVGGSYLLHHSPPLSLLPPNPQSQAELMLKTLFEQRAETGRAFLIFWEQLPNLFFNFPAGVSRARSSDVGAFPWLPRHYFWFFFFFCPLLEAIISKMGHTNEWSDANFFPCRKKTPHELDFSLKGSGVKKGSRQAVDYKLFPRGLRQSRKFHGNRGCNALKWHLSFFTTSERLTLNFFLKCGTTRWRHVTCILLDVRLFVTTRSRILTFPTVRGTRNRGAQRVLYQKLSVSFEQIWQGLCDPNPDPTKKGHITLRSALNTVHNLHLSWTPCLVT